MMGFAPGSTVRYRFHRPDGSEGQVHPLRVLADDGNELVGWLPAGTPILGTRLSDGRRMRDAPLADRFRLPRERYASTWRGTSNVRRVVDGEWSAVWWFFDEDLRFTGWYVNLEIPLGRTDDGVDRIDGVLDLAVAPDRTWEWKDEDEAAAAVTAGRLTAEQLGRLRAEGERVIGLVEAGSYPFDGTWTAFRPDPAWPRPEL